MWEENPLNPFGTTNLIHMLGSDPGFQTGSLRGERERKKPLSQPKIERFNLIQY